MSRYVARWASLTLTWVGAGLSFIAPIPYAFIALTAAAMAAIAGYANESSWEDCDCGRH